MIRHLFYGQVSLGHWREFYKLWEKLDETVRAKNLAPSQLWAPTVGTLNSFMPHDRVRDARCVPGQPDRVLR